VQKWVNYGYVSPYFAHFAADLHRWSDLGFGVALREAQDRGESRAAGTNSGNRPAAGNRPNINDDMNYRAAGIAHLRFRISDSPSKLVLRHAHCVPA